MIKKIENCLYCGEKMDSITAKKRFCKPRCRVYWNRSKKCDNPGQKEDTILSPKIIVQEQVSIPQIPTRNEGENAFDFAARKNEWKRKYGG